MYQYTHPSKKIILDRLNGIITFPNVFYGKPITIPFDKVLAALKLNGMGAPVSLGFYHHKILATNIDLDYSPKSSWSFIVWYMDKNRPLPPGEAFDPYREKDFHRRKAEGFLPPLYKSNIPTGDSIVFTEDFTKNKNSQENNAISKKNSIKKRKKK